MTLEERLIEIVKVAPHRMAVFKVVSSLNLPDCFIAGGFIRNAVWDSLYEKEDMAPINDVDVVYFKPLDAYGMDVSEVIEQIRANRMNPVWEEENRAQKILEAEIPGLVFEVRNQARMHLSKAKDKSYISIIEALSDWIETSTPIGIRMHEKGGLEIISPQGLDDLFSGILRATRKDHETRLHERAKAKSWLIRWPKLRFEPCK